MASDPTIHDEVATLLRRADQRYTSGRQRLVEVLLRSGAPLTIAQILADDDRLAQSSVYRNLVILEQVGAVTRIVTRDDYARYELAEQLTDHHHHHLICTECGDVRDFALTSTTEDRLDEALRDAARSAGFRVQGHRLDLLGTCPSCP
ncbi:MAG: transcriptional repressor [Acidimicrobiales bacterium]|nr:transcriptional repressor [Acidimicrobiales bacterium]